MSCAMSVQSLPTSRFPLSASRQLLQNRRASSTSRRRKAEECSSCERLRTLAATSASCLCISSRRSSFAEFGEAPFVFCPSVIDSSASRWPMSSCKSLAIRVRSASCASINLRLRLERASSAILLRDIGDHSDHSLHLSLCIKEGMPMLLQPDHGTIRRRTHVDAADGTR